MSTPYENRVFKNNDQFTTAVLFVIFNRPDTTSKVFQAIRKAQPPRLYVAADGPREGRVDDVELVDTVRGIATNVDWPCEVKTLFREKNLGCKLAVSGAISWFFDNEEQGIILEDDCLPSQSFFSFCEQLLDKYKNNEMIFIISGYNKQNQWNPKLYDYFFSNFGGIWGWASWRRAWKYYDGEMNDLEAFVDKNLFDSLLGKELGKVRKHELIRAKQKNEEGTNNSWAYPWALSRHLKSGLACVPSRSLILNIGFGEDATHTVVKPAEEIQVQELGFPIKDNPSIVPDKEYDLLWLNVKKQTIGKQTMRKLIHRLKNYISF